jgi:hypothetical protein
MHATILKLNNNNKKNNNVAKLRSIFTIKKFNFVASKAVCIFFNFIKSHRA